MYTLLSAKLILWDKTLRNYQSYFQFGNVVWVSNRSMAGCGAGIDILRRPASRLSFDTCTTPHCVRCKCAGCRPNQSPIEEDSHLNLCEGGIVKDWHLVITHKSAICLPTCLMTDFYPPNMPLTRCRFAQKWQRKRCG